MTTNQQMPNEIEIFGVKCEFDLAISTSNSSPYYFWQGQQKERPFLDVSIFKYIENGWLIRLGWFPDGCPRIVLYSEVKPTLDEAKKNIELKFKAMLDANRLIQGRII